ncbi:hypothetical protein ACHMW6_28910 [Pseudoduganella sp. UC29_106]|uniref:hypothetical protein n=1 Tax=Pseudoduganella sp. UC29_106 TaxID=3374553 RepID=UPI0037569FA7
MTSANKIIRWLLISYSFLFFSHAQAEKIDFENFFDNQAVTNQIGGLSFLNALALQAGASLNEFEFPPNSGTVVLSDDGGPMQILFAAPISSFGAYFTYLDPLKMTAFDADGNVVGSQLSQFSSNLRLSGDAGSVPNELLSLIYFGGISKIEIIGSSSGYSFTMDDLSVSSLSSTPIPEPSSFALFVIAFFAIGAVKYHSASRWLP